MWLPILYTADRRPVDGTDEPLLEGHFVEMMNADQAVIVNDKGHLVLVQAHQIRFPDGTLGAREHLVFEK